MNRSKLISSFIFALLISGSAFATDRNNDRNSGQGDQGQAQGQGQIQGQIQGILGSGNSSSNNAGIGNSRVDNSGNNVGNSRSSSNGVGIAGALSASKSGSTSKSGAAATLGDIIISVTEAAPAPIPANTTHTELVKQEDYTITTKNTPGLVAGNVYPTAPCMGTTTAGGVTTALGLTFGTSWKDDDCSIRETARSFATMQMNDDAIAVLCSSAYAAAAPSCKARAKVAAQEQAAELQKQNANVNPALAPAADQVAAQQNASNIQLARQELNRTDTSPVIAMQVAEVK